MLNSDLHDLTSAWRGLFLTLRYPRNAVLRRCGRYCVRKELPFAGYSVVKERHLQGRTLRCAPTSENRGGEYRARTGDLLVANQALSQLS